MYKILVIEDDEKIVNLIKDKLEKYEYEVVTVKDYSNIKSEFIKGNPHLVLLDINLPNYDGFFWCRELRSMSKVPIIFISARSSDMDQVMAIENGGDDYIIKPFSFDLLLAKVKGAIRRTYGEYAENTSKDIYEVDGIYLYKSQSMVEWKGNKIELSKKEFGLLYILVSNLNEIVSREILLEELWDDVDFVDDNTLSVNITRLRKRLEEIGVNETIQTKRGQGYSMIKTWE
jgi:DNA-binding response OmpR family regulator